MNIVELSNVQRDSNYEEAQLVVKVKQGNEAGRAFDLQRRVPVIVIGGLMFALGVPLILSTTLFGAPIIHREIGVVVLEPGLTMAFFSLLPGDDWIIEKIMMLLVGADVIFALVFAYPTVPILTAYFQQQSTCVDYQGEVVPCWCSAIQAAMFLLIGALSFEVGVRRVFMSLYTKQNIGGRLELLWGLWGRWLVGYAVFNLFFNVLPYLLFPGGRKFLGSGSGAVLVLCMIESLAFGKFSLTESWWKGSQEWLAQWGTVTDAMAVAALVSRGGETLEDVMNNAKAKLRCIPFSSMDISDFNFTPHSSGLPHVKYAKSVHCSPRDIDLFVSHSWRDPPLAKWDALVAYCEKFSREHNREPKIWIDCYCVDPGSKPEPQYHPIFLMASNRLVVLMGPTYMTRMWCLMELFMFVEAGGATSSSIDVLAIAGCTFSAADTDANFASYDCSSESDTSAMAKVVEACGSATNFNHRLREILCGIALRIELGQEEDADTSETTVRVKTRRLSGTIRLTQELEYLLRQFDKFTASCWW